MVSEPQLFPQYHLHTCFSLQTLCRECTLSSSISPALKTKVLPLVVAVLYSHYCFDGLRVPEEKGMSRMVICFLEPPGVNGRNEKPLGAEGLSLRLQLQGQPLVTQGTSLSLSTSCAVLPDTSVITVLALHCLVTFCSWFPGTYTYHQSITSMSR